MGCATRRSLLAQRATLHDKSESWGCRRKIIIILQLYSYNRVFFHKFKRINMAMSDEEQYAWIRLTLEPGIGPVTARHLLVAFGLPQ
ncbi:MAG TPA: DNA-protecting protein DprA, partial [Advenella sp.]|nr:DNA-protecting protein DprA [Advenella sp.]